MRGPLAAWGVLVSLLGCSTPESPPQAGRPKVYLFITTDCPLANSYAPEINRISAQYGPLGIDFALVYVDSGASLGAVQKHAAEYGYTAELILDPDHQRVDRWGIQVTPEAAVVLPDGTLAYRGRIDDRGIELGRVRAEPTRKDLREALDAILAGSPVPHPQTPAVGCYVPTRP